MTRKPRTLAGFALLLAFVFYAFSFAGSCGVVGHALAHAITSLVGTVGSALIAFVLAVFGIHYLAPILDTPRRRRHHARRMVRSALDHVLHTGTVEVLPPSQRMRLQDVRGALKNFGYRQHEIEPVVARMDPAQPLEVLVRTGLKALQKVGN